MKRVRSTLVATIALAGAGLTGAPSAPGSAERAVAFLAQGVDTVTLEGLLQIPGGKPGPAVVICHPNPMAGGNMDNSIVEDLQAAFAKAGFATLRFNFRGVGRSRGAFDSGFGEVSDCLGALEFLRRQPGVDPARVSVVGYSFGAMVGLQACVRDGKTPACVCLGFPARGEGDVARCVFFKGIVFPTLFVGGTEDAVCKLGVLDDIVRSYGVGKLCRIEPIQGADHLLSGVGQRGIAIKRIVKFVSAAPAR
jgi:alpha/beta superfamily hydrolase